MGILNITPDSFYDHGRYQRRDTALARAIEMVAEGADIIDIGGEKAGPGEPVSVEEEKRRVLPIIDAVRRETTQPLSIDTWKPEVARAAIEGGADIINCIAGLDDPAMRQVAIDTHAALVAMHIQGRPRVANPHPVYQDVTEDVLRDLKRQVELCIDAGIEPSSIVIDPGPGFGKTTEHDILLMRRLRSLASGGHPLLLAVSRKKFIGDVLGLPTEERLEGSLAVTAWGVLCGVSIIRTHDVRATVRVTRMTEAVLHPEWVGGERQ